MTLPLVSILIPCYNAEKWIGQTLECALNQTWPSKEIIVVDDGSTDSSFEIIKSFEKLGVKAIRQNHAGASAARNRALSEARGDYFQYLDADDLLSPDKIEIQMKKLIECGPDFVASCGWMWFSNSIKDAKKVMHPPDKDLQPVEFMVDLWTHGKVMVCHNWLVPRKLTERTGKWNETLSYHDDSEYFWRIVLLSKGVKFCEGAVSYYRWGSTNSLSSMDSENKALSAYNALNLSSKNLLSAEDSPRTRKAAAAQYYALAYNLYPHFSPVWKLAFASAKNLHDSKDTSISIFTPRMKKISSLFGWKITRRLHRLRDCLSKKKSS